MTPAATDSPAAGHCPYRQAALLQQALEPGKMRVAFLLGAGCPLAIRVADGVGTKPLIPDIAGLTEQVRSAIEQSEDHASSFTALLKHLTDDGHEKPNVEEILSRIRGLRGFLGARTIDGLSKGMLETLESAICDKTTEIVRARLPSTGTPYHQLAAWIRGIKRSQPVEIFTPNYDLLMEQALEESRVPYFDGFVGSDRTFFDVGAMEQDELPARWARLWKLHGSINWWQTNSGQVERREKRDGDGACRLIHPSHLKYDESRRMPYLAMLDRLRAFLTRGQAVLVICGYSFSDQHLNEVILQGLSGNPTAICFGLLFGDRAQSVEAVSHARTHPNLSLLAVDGAVLGTAEKDWHSAAKPEHPLQGVAVKSGAMPGRTDAAPERCKFLLGDFGALGEFLAHSLPYRGAAEGINNAP